VSHAIHELGIQTDFGGHMLPDSLKIELEQTSDYNYVAKGQCYPSLFANHNKQP